MPKKTVGFFMGVVILGVIPARAATSCDPGYYLDGGTCRNCGSGYYCTGGTAPRVDCIETLPDGAPIPYHYQSVVGATWGAANATEAYHCMCDWAFSDETRIKYVHENRCMLGATGPQYTQYQWCRTGHYAINPLNSGNWYTNCAPCDNAPAHAHYTSYSTPSVMYAVESNCPWECDAGYGRVGDVCQPLCTAGVTQIHAGTNTAPLFPVKYTTPTLVIRTPGGICYGNLTAGHGTGIHVTVGGTTYRME